MLPTLRGWNKLQLAAGNAVAATDAVLRPARRADLADRAPCTSSGDTSDCTKLNCPIGQTYLQNEPPRNRPSTTKAARSSRWRSRPSTTDCPRERRPRKPRGKATQQATPKPLAPQPARPARGRPAAAPGQRARQQERTGHAEDVADGEQAEDDAGRASESRAGRPARFIAPTCGPRRPSKIRATAEAAAAPAGPAGRVAIGGSGRATGPARDRNRPLVSLMTRLVCCGDS